MTFGSTWCRLSMGAKTGLGVAVVLGAMACSDAGHAITFLDSKSFVGSAALKFTGDGYSGGSNSISANDGWTIDLTTNDASGLYFVEFNATEALRSVSVTTPTPQAGFKNARMGWFSKYALDSDGNHVFDDSDGSGSWEYVVANEDLDLSTTFAAYSTLYLVYSWWGGLNTSDASLTTKLSAEVPLPASVVFLLAGLAGVGLLGRYKARGRQPA